MPDSLVLCYHAVSPTWRAPLSVTPSALESQLERLVQRGYRGATFSDLALGRVQGPAVSVTFDDAFRSVGLLAGPILARLGLPGTVFVPTDFPDRQEPMAWPGIDRWLGGPHEHELSGMSWGELAALAEDGWEIGSHSCSHPRLSALPDSELSHELTDSRRVCEDRIGRRCSSVAYPYGDVDGRVARAAGRAGYRAGAALPVRPHRPAPLVWPRVGVYHTDEMRRFRLKVSRAMRLARGTAWRRVESPLPRQAE